MITVLPPAPDRSAPATFASRGDALMAALVVFVTEANTLQTDVTARQTTASVAAVDASASQVAAAASALAAALSSTATVWISGATYAIGDVRFSPVNFQNYRRKTAGSGIIDPSIDTTGWVGLLASFGAGSSSIFLSTNYGAM